MLSFKPVVRGAVDISGIGSVQLSFDSPGVAGPSPPPGAVAVACVHKRRLPRTLGGSGSPPRSRLPHWVGSWWMHRVAVRTV